MTAFIVNGLGIGDEGKGAIVDLLCRLYSARANVRFSAGPQASHHVISDSGVAHCFASIGAGSFSPGVHTHLGRRVLVKVSNLLVEVDELLNKGLVMNGRLTIDPECGLVLPWHAGLSRMLEEARGTGRHGSVGIGVGTCWRDRDENPASYPRFGDLLRPELLAERLEASFERTSRRAAVARKGLNPLRAAAIWDDYSSRCPPAVVLRDLLRVAHRCSSWLLRDEAVCTTLGLSTAPIVLEGTHGILLDPVCGFSPHTTDCDITYREAERFLERAGYTGSTTRVGVLRAYASRHGAGPLVTHDEALTRMLPEAHNVESPWQGAVRAGWFDLVASSYALRVSGGVDALAITQLDRMGVCPAVKVCTEYEYNGPDTERLEALCEVRQEATRTIITALKSVGEAGEMSAILSHCTPATFRTFQGWGVLVPPQHESDLPCPLRTFIQYIEEALATPVGILSFGPGANEKLVRISV